MADAKAYPHLLSFLRSFCLAAALFVCLASLAAGETHAAQVRQQPQAAVQQPAGEPLLFTILHQENLSPNDTFNILFVADQEFGGFDDPLKLNLFRTAVGKLVNDGMAYNGALAVNWAFFSLWFTTLQAEVKSTGSVCPSVSLPAGVLNVKREGDEVLVPDLIVVLHNEPGGHCAWSSPVRTVSIGMPQLAAGVLPSDAPRILVHEMGHSLGLPDEYTSAYSYYAAPPVLYASEADCMNDPANAGWRSGQPCQMLLTADEGAAFWRSEQDPNIMSAGGDQVIEFGPSNWAIMKRFFSDERGVFLIVHDPPVFAPKDYAPLATPTPAP